MEHIDFQKDKYQFMKDIKYKLGEGSRQVNIKIKN